MKLHFVITPIYIDQVITLVGGLGKDDLTHLKD